MTVQFINPTTALLYLTRAQLRQRGLHPDALTYEHTSALAKEGLSSLGQATTEVLKLESYPDKAGLLLFVHTSLTGPVVWRFFDGDALLDAVAALPDLESQPLYWWQEDFWLTGTDCAPLSEFADPVDDPFLTARLAEYAQPLS